MKNRVIKKIMAYLLVGAMVITTPMTASATESELQKAYGERSDSDTDNDEKKLWSNSDSDTNTRTSTQATVPIPDTVQKHELNILGITLDKSEMELDLEERKSGFLKARVLFDDWNAEDEEMDWVTKEEKEAIEKEIKWFSDDPKVAVVGWGSNGGDNTLASVMAKSAGQAKIYAWIEADGLAYVNSNRPTEGDYIAEATVTVVDDNYEISFKEMKFATGRNYDLKDYISLQYGKGEKARKVDLKDSAEQVVFSNVKIIEAADKKAKASGVKLSDDGILNITKNSKLAENDKISVDIATASGKSATGTIEIVKANNVKTIRFKGTKDEIDMGSNADYKAEELDDQKNVIEKAKVSKEIGWKVENNTGKKAILEITWDDNSETAAKTDELTWTSSNASIVTVKPIRVSENNNIATKAEIIPQNIGNAKITVASAAGKKATLTVTVKATPASIEIDHNKDTQGKQLPIYAWSGKAITLTATMKGENGLVLPATATKLGWATTETDKDKKKNAKVTTNKDNSGKVLPITGLLELERDDELKEDVATYHVKVSTKAKFNGKQISSEPVELTFRQSNIGDITINEVQNQEVIQVIGRLPQIKSDLRKLYVGNNTYRYNAAAYVPEGQKLVLAGSEQDSKNRAGIEDSIVWSVKSAKVATIDDNGNLVPVGPGKTDVTASYVSLKYTNGKPKATVRKKTISVQVIQKATSISFAKEIQVINPKPGKSINATFTIKNVTPKKATYNVTDWKVLAQGPEGKITNITLDGSKNSDAIAVDSRDKNGNLKKAAKITIPDKLAQPGTVIKVGAYTDGGAVAYGYLYITDKTTKVTAELTGDKVNKEGNKVSIRVGDTASIKASVIVNNTTKDTEPWKINKETTNLGVNTPNTYVTEPVTYSLDKNSAKLIRVDSNGKVTALKKGKAKVTVSTLSGKKTTVSFEVKVKEAPKAESAK